jgi:dihydroorotate dehydrogenase
MQPRFSTFGPCWDQSGVRGFFGEGYWFHRLWSPLGFDLSRSTFVAKTTTWAPREGNMPLQKFDGFSWGPRDWMPKCIVVKPWNGVVLNAVGLSGPGAEALFSTGRWAFRSAPFMISFMSLETSDKERYREMGRFCDLLDRRLINFQAPLGLQVNLSCPNVGTAPRPSGEFVRETGFLLNRLGAITDRVAVFVKLSVTTQPEVAAEIASHPCCAGLVVSNTIPWGTFPDRIDWARLFGVRLTASEDGTASLKSPLAHLGGGGLSGAPLLPLVASWLRNFREFSQAKVAAGGGILQPDDVDVLYEAGANAVCVGSAAILRPWRVRAIVDRAHKLLGGKQ